MKHIQFLYIYFLAILFSYASKSVLLFSQSPIIPHIKLSRTTKIINYWSSHQSSQPLSIEMSDNTIQNEWECYSYEWDVSLLNLIT